MQYYVRELANKRAMLVAVDGYPLSSFDTVEDAVATCIVDCRTAPLWIEWHNRAHICAVDGDCVQQSLAHHFRLGTSSRSKSMVATAG